MTQTITTQNSTSHFVGNPREGNVCRRQKRRSENEALGERFIVNDYLVNVLHFHFAFDHRFMLHCLLCIIIIEKKREKRARSPIE